MYDTQVGIVKKLKIISQVEWAPRRVTQRRVTQRRSIVFPMWMCFWRFRNEIDLRKSTNGAFESDGLCKLSCVSSNKPKREKLDI